MDEPYVHKIFSGKEQVQGKIWLSKTGFSADDIKDRAVFAYPIKHYTYWEEQNSGTINIGAMGENFAILEMDEFSVCIGDTFQVGDAVIQVSQPGKASTRQLRNSMRTGWYFRVLQEGDIQEGTDLELLERPYTQWTIAACNEIMYVNKYDLRMTDELYECKLLGVQWRRALRKRVRGF
ncbi:MOSC domain-containing protein [Oceanobacillus salinisoli]|uniref:MOSC domain-containing protein n=1 Tax=Oceanobacillus salinisoli TaxID=2678611 RepID=UPI0012E1574D|nr:MOSC domain-containing protein [Oceanobacillus salinisoli]